ncbi:hypothetical protein CS542_01610 [Pedobacter sp. IW39]|nr:hypothetical protein CS542_01610 [Pedobacter sp. IW39]
MRDMPLTMGYNREDIPFYYALADSFTVCDHSFCSSLTGTSPNRTFSTGKIREEQNDTPKLTSTMETLMDRAPFVGTFLSVCLLTA